MLQPLPGERTRLLSRNRWPRGSAGQRLGMLLMEPASLVMERKMLLGIKRRAERDAHRGAPASGAAAIRIGGGGAAPTRSTFQRARR